MEVLLTHLSQHAPFLILVGAFVDIFFLTGYLFYGFALLSGITVLHATGQVTVPEVLIAAYVGTVTAGYVNYAIGYYFGTTEVVHRLINHKRGERVRRFLTTKNLFAAMVFCRFITILRPLYMLVLGALQVTPQRVLAFETGIAAFWVIFWVFVFIFGEHMILFVTRLLFSVV